MMILASNILQAHTRQSVYGSHATFTATVSSGHKKKTITYVLAVLLSAYVLLSLVPISASARTVGTSSGLNMEIESSSLDIAERFSASVQCNPAHVLENNSDIFCKIYLKNNYEGKIGLDFVAKNEELMIRFTETEKLNTFVFDGHTGAIFSLLQHALPRVRMKWLDLGSNTFLDKRELDQMKDTVLGELYACMHDGAELCILSNDAGLMIRSLYLYRSAPVLGSDFHIKDKLDSLDSLLEKGIQMKHNSDGVTVKISEELSLHIRFKEVGPGMPIPRMSHSKEALGAALDAALSLN